MGVLIRSHRTRHTFPPHNGASSIVSVSLGTLVTLKTDGIHSSKIIVGYVWTKEQGFVAIDDAEPPLTQIGEQDAQDPPVSYAFRYHVKGKVVILTNLLTSCDL